MTMTRDIDRPLRSFSSKTRSALRCRRYPVLLLTGLFLVGLTPAVHAGPVRLKPGDILVADRDANPNVHPLCQPDPRIGENCRGVLFRIDPVTGKRDIVTDFNNPQQGRLGATPLGVAIETTGKILVVDGNAGTPFIKAGVVEVPEPGALFRVDPVTQKRAVISDFGVFFQGEVGFVGKDPDGIALQANGHILVVDPTSQGLFRVDPVTQLRTTAVNLNPGDSTVGPTAQRPRFVAVGRTGRIFISDEGQDNAPGVILRQSSVHGLRTILTDFSDCGPVPRQVPQKPEGIAIDQTGQIWVVTAAVGQSLGGLFRVHPKTGTCTLISDFTDLRQDQADRHGRTVHPVAPRNVAIEVDGNLLVTDSQTQAYPGGFLFRVHPHTGERSLVSDFADPHQGPTGSSPWGVAVFPDIVPCPHRVHPD